jgi:putative ABC transport system substrate-binding protein
LPQDSITLSLIAFAAIFGGANFGVILRHALPERQLAEDTKDVVTWPLALSAQQPAKVYRIAVVHTSHPIEQLSEGASGRPVYKAFFGELRRLGYVEGQNLIVERYSGEGKIAHYADLADEVVRQQPDLIFSNSTRLILRFKEATSTIPIVGAMADPIAWGVVDSLARPGG